MENKILCCVFNHNDNEKSSMWADRLSPHFETLILDSGSSPACTHPLSLTLPNIYYSGLMNKAFELLCQKDYRWLMIVTSDIEIDDKHTERLIASMKEISKTTNVALYQPSCRISFRGRALHQSCCHFTGRIRKVNFQEGWFHLASREVLADVLPMNVELNKFGWGVDLALCHYARMRNMLILVDDRVRVLHPKGTGYNKESALLQMREWHKTLPGYTSPRHFRPSKDPIKY